MSAAVFRRTSWPSTKPRTSTHAPAFATSLARAGFIALWRATPLAAVSHRIGPYSRESARDGAGQIAPLAQRAAMTTLGPTVRFLSRSARRVRARPDPPPPAFPLAPRVPSPRVSRDRVEFGVIIGASRHMIMPAALGVPVGGTRRWGPGVADRRSLAAYPAASWEHVPDPGSWMRVNGHA